MGALEVGRITNCHSYAVRKALKLVRVACYLLPVMGMTNITRKNAEKNTRSGVSGRGEKRQERRELRFSQTWL